MNPARARRIATTPVIEFSQLGVLLELMWHGDKAMVTKCSFCQTMNREGAIKCKGCSGKLPAAYRNRSDADVPATDGEGAGNAHHEMANVLRWVLAMPLALCALFAAWFGVHVGERQAPPSVSAISAIAATVPDRQPSPSMLQPALAATVTRPEQHQAARVREDSEPDIIEESASQAQLETPEVAAAPAPVPKAVHARAGSSPLHVAQDPTAACNGEMFLLRAICMNRRCAEAQNARHPRCAEVLKQRRIDEARRNPTLIG